jgi:hypothetical protein
MQTEGFDSSLDLWAVPVGSKYDNNESGQKELATCVSFAPKPR